MNRFKCVAPGLLAWGLMMTPNASAAVMLDQSNVPGTNYYNPLGPTYVPGEQTAEMAQVFTPGFTGHITSIDVDLLIFNYYPTTPISLRLLALDGSGVPDTSTPLSATVTNNVSPGTGFVSFDFSSQNINLTAGVPVAYWLTADPVTGFSRWLNGLGGSYSGGQTFWRFPGATDGYPTTFTAVRNESAYFQTFMDTTLARTDTLAPTDTPEPSTAAIAGLGLLALGLLRRPVIKG